jgi:tRNA threonylcarbamoyladenosine dehydratase
MWTERTQMLLGEDSIGRLAASNIVVVGLGGVGGFACEMLARAGVGHLTLIDCDTVGETNLNRQIIALHSTLGEPKAEVLRRRLLDINPSLDILVIDKYVHEDTLDEVFGEIGRSPDYVVDAIDTLSPKIALIQYCLGHSLRLVSSMGSGAKLDATAVRADDISRTKMCPLAHMLRKRLHHLGIYEGFTAVYSVEAPRRTSVVLEESRNKKSQVGSISYLPAVFGCVCAQVVVRDITDI